MSIKNMIPHDLDAKLIDQYDVLHISAERKGVGINAVIFVC